MDEIKEIEDDVAMKECEKNEARKKVNDTHKKRVEELKKNNSKINFELTAAHKKNGDLERELKEMKIAQRQKETGKSEKSYNTTNGISRYQQRSNNLQNSASNIA